jgi:hypothetical protein
MQFLSSGELRDRMQKIKDANKDDPVILSSVSKVMREGVSTTGLIHALDQAADNNQEWTLEVPDDVFLRAQVQVNYHTTVALRARPPAAAGGKDVAVFVDDSADTVRLRTTVLAMQGVTPGGTELKRMGTLGGLTPEAWRNGDGRLLQSYGIIEINVRNHGYSVTKTCVPCIDTDLGGYDDFKTMLKDKLRLDVEDYQKTLAPAAEPVRRKPCTVDRAALLDAVRESLHPRPKQEAIQSKLEKVPKRERGEVEEEDCVMLLGDDCVDGVAEGSQRCKAKVGVRRML